MLYSLVLDETLFTSDEPGTVKPHSPEFLFGPICPKVKALGLQAIPSDPDAAHRQRALWGEETQQSERESSFSRL